MKKLSLLLSLILAAVLLCSCAAAPTTQVVATTLPVYQFTQRLCEGTGLGVTRLVTESISCLHDYTLQVSQMRSIEAAELVVISGGGLEDFLSDALAGSRCIVDASSGIELYAPEHEHEHAHEGHHHHDHDPHIWLSPVLAQTMAENICQGLSQHYPAYRDTFERNLKGLKSDLQALQLYGEQELASLGCRDLITFHDGFHYFAEAFDLNILEKVEEEAGSEAPASELIRLISLVREHHIPAIFTETNGSTAAAGVIAAETGISVFQLDMGMAGDDYFASMYRNIDTLKEALK